MTFIRAGIPVHYSQGFNPLPRLEIASPLSIGVKACGEIALIETEGFFEAEKFKKLFNDFLPDGFEVIEAMNIYIPHGSKKHSVSSLLWGYSYTGVDGKTELVPAKDEKIYRGGNVYGLERLAILAKTNNPEQGESYFKVYRQLYPF